MIFLFNFDFIIKTRFLIYQFEEIMIKLIEHPIVEHNLTLIRNKNTSNAEFRNAADIITIFLASSALENLNLAEVSIETPMEPTIGKMINSDVVVVPVLRAGLSLLGTFARILPSAKISFIGLARNEEDFKTNEYYFSLPNTDPDAMFIILEMMIATGGSVCSTLSRLQLEGASDFTVCSIIAAPEGIENIITEFPDARIITTSLDRELNSNKYILPGLGDAGDRWCGV